MENVQNYFFSGIQSAVKHIFRPTFDILFYLSAPHKLLTPDLSNAYNLTTYIVYTSYITVK